MFKNKKINYLISGLNKKSGRNSRGKITVYHKGGGNKINYRIIDFKIIDCIFFILGINIISKNER